MKCPCGSQQAYTNCCGLYIEGAQYPTTPEALMRSRYTAYSLANTAYIKKTMRGKPLVGFDEIEAKRWAKKVIWLDLQVINTSVPNHVEFIARFIDSDNLKAIHEASQFVCDQGIWYYIDGQQKPTKTTPMLRNTLCPCGSQKKYKNCHAKREAV